MTESPSVAGGGPAAEGRSRTGLGLCGGFLVFAAVIGFLYFTSANRLAAQPAFAEYGLLMWAGTVAALLTGLLTVLVARGPAGRGPRVLLALGALLAVLFAGCMFVSGLRDRAVTFLLAILFFAAVLSFGSRLLKLLLPDCRRGFEEVALSGALGLAGMALLFFLLGQVGLFRGWVLAATLAVAGVSGLNSLRVRVERFAGECTGLLRRAGVGGGLLIGAVVLVYLIRLAHCFSPATFSHLDYDALEYHLAAPMEWLASGFVSFLPHNTYANMPSGCELLWATGISMAPGIEGGFQFARLVSLGCSELATIAVYALTRRLAGRMPALAAAGMFFCSTWLSDLTVNPYVEPLLVLLIAATGLALLLAVRKNASGVRGFVLAGVLAGGCCAVKYTAMPLVGLPLVLMVPVAGFFRGSGLRVSVMRTVLTAALSLAVVAPWLIRNWISGGNPVYPLAAGVFGSPDWDDQRMNAWHRAHSRPLTGSGSRARPRSVFIALHDFFWGRAESSGKLTLVHLENLRTGPLLLILLPLGVCGIWRARRRGALYPAFAVLAYVAGWGLFTHQAPRFLFPAGGLFAVLAGVGIRELPGRRGTAIGLWTVLVFIVLLLPAQFLFVRVCRGFPNVRVLAGVESREKFFAATPARDSFEAVTAVNSLPEGSRVMLLGEVRRALFRIPVIYATVWDEHPLRDSLAGMTASEARQSLLDCGVTHLLWNWGEFYRLRRSYGYLEMPDVEKETFAALENNFMLKAGAWGGYLQGPGGRPLANPLTGRPTRQWELWQLKTGPE